MTFQERSYSGKLFRPKPEIHSNPDGGLLIVATPWGNRQSARHVIQTMTDYFHSATEDGEVTTPFARISCLSTMANNLRTAALLANDALYREENRKEYVTGVELFAAARVREEVVWLQLGQPLMLLIRAQRDIMPLGSHLDLSLDNSGGSELLPPLPNQLLGLDPVCNFTISSFKALPQDQLLLVSRSSLPGRLYTLDKAQRTMKGFSELLAHDQPESPFWLGLWEV